MKLLLDQNISYKAIKELSKHFGEVGQVGRLGMAQTEDDMVWQYARIHNYTLVTFEPFFKEKNQLFGNAIKVIWLRFSNISTKNVIRILLEKSETIKDFMKNEELSCLEIS